MDHNVFLDLHGDESVHRDPDSQGLLADWIQEEIDLFLSEEVYNEINRRGADDKERARLRAVANAYSRMPCDHGKFLELTKALEHILPTDNDPGNESDVRHVARAIATGSQVLVTRDGVLLENSAILLERFGLTVLRPSDLVARVDEVRREQLYRPVRLSGTLCRIKRLGSNENEDSLFTQFQRPALAETKAEFLAIIRSALASPNDSSVEELRDPERHPLGLIALRESPESLTVQLIREGRGPLSATVARQLVERAVRTSAERLIPRVLVEDKHATDQMRGALVEAGFRCSWEGTWAKENLFEVRSTADLASFADVGASGLDAFETLGIEHCFRPLKFWDLEVPTYLVPITVFLKVVVA